EAAAVQIQEPHIRVSAGCEDPFAGNGADLCLEELDVLDGRFTARPHALSQCVEVEVIGPERRALVELFQVVDPFPSNLSLNQFRDRRLSAERRMQTYQEHQ